MEKDSESENLLEQDKVISINQSDASDAFAKHLGMFIEPVGAHLIERTRALSEWVRQRTELSTWPYARALDQAPATTTRIRSQNGITVEGFNFGSQDYLGLSQHYAIRDAAVFNAAS